MSNDDNLIVEVLEDGTEITIDLNVCNDVADKVMTRLFEIEENEELKNFDAAASIFSLFINSIYVLSDYGWSEAELKKEIEDHCQQRKNSLN
jgi:hypothetical protein